MKKAPMKIGVIGCGNISRQYFQNAARHHEIDVVACASLGGASAEAMAAEFGLRAMSVDELIRDSGIDLILNLTVPAVHAEISLRALNAGKHVYSEKPLTVTLEDGRRILETAREKKLRVGCAPDTILGDSQQCVREHIDSGTIGDVVSGMAVLMSRGPEAWHPNPFFFYEKGAGPMFDIGPYYLTALVNFLGPVRAVFATAKTSFPERTAGSKEHFGKTIRVDVPTHYSGVLEFESGAQITCVISWEVWKHGHASIELYGSEGSAQLLTEPYLFGGGVKLFRQGGEDWEEQTVPERYASGCRLVGVAEMARAICENRPHICSGELAYHVLEIMHAFEASSKQQQKIGIKSRCERPARRPDGL